MELPEAIRRGRSLLLVLLILFTPIVILVITLGFLQIAEGLVPGELSALELLELYVIELVVFAVTAYVLYRASMTAMEGRVAEPPGERDHDAERGESERWHRRPMSGRDQERDRR